MTDLRARRAAMLDRDGTIIVDQHYLADAAQVVLLPGASDAIRMLTAAGVPSVVCSNQSGIARGLVSLAQHRQVRRAVDELLQAEGVALLDAFYCPHHESVTGPCECRKPGTRLYEQAAALHGLDLSRCMYAGDKYRDVAAAVRFGGAAYLIRSADTSQEDQDRAAREGIAIVPSLLEATRQFLERTR